MNSEQYTEKEPLPKVLSEYAGPKGLALVAAYPNGSTSKGWGSDKFMQNYTRKVFREGPVLHGYERGRHAFAIVMRSVQLICIDIDGKNGGIEHAAQLLGNVPLTLAETSKSGNGYHLFFTYEDEWNSETGFAGLSDFIGIVQGVDIRSVGCVYHHPQQRWNKEQVAPLPSWIADKLKKRVQLRAAKVQAATAISKLDIEEKLVMQEDLITQLKQPIPAGKRNNTLFALGTQLKLAEVSNWEGMVSYRATELGLPFDEIEKLVTNIALYGTEDSI